MIRDYKHYQDQRALKAKRKAQDAALVQRHAMFDAQASEVRMKYERASFSVVGEGSREAQDAYRANYDRINWRNDGDADRQRTDLETQAASKPVRLDPDV